MNNKINKKKLLKMKKILANIRMNKILTKIKVQDKKINIKVCNNHNFMIALMNQNNNIIFNFILKMIVWVQLQKVIVMKMMIAIVLLMIGI